MGGKSGAPPAPDYIGMAKESGQQQLNLAKYTTAANRINQNTPTGSLTYTQNPDGTWTSNTSLSAPQQAILSGNQNIQIGAENLANQNLQNSASNLTTPLSAQNLPQMPQNAGMTTQNVIMSRLQPQIDRENAQLDARLANQGITPGSEAYITAHQLQDQQHNDLLTQATGTGVQMDMQAADQGIKNASAIQNQNLNVINALRSGASPTSGTSYNPGMMPTPNAPDLTGAAQGMYNANMGIVNANNANNASMWQTGVGLGTLGYLAYSAMSDRRAKKNIKQIGSRKDGLNIYQFEYKPGFGDSGPQIGFMADEVEKLYPHAVMTNGDGYKMVNYAAVPRG